MGKIELEEELFEKKKEYDNLLEQDIVNENKKIQLELVIQRLTRQLNNIKNK